MPDSLDDQVFLLATDIERSTRWWAERPDEMAEATARHDSALREIFMGHGGTLVPRLWEGDSAFAWFGEPSVAFAAGLEVQRLSGSLCVGDQPLRLRAAIHAAHLDPGGSLPGLDVSRVLMIRSIAHGGQVLISRAAAVADVQGVSFIDLGWHRIASGGDRVRLYQLAHRDLEQDFPPLRTIESSPNNIGIQLSSFVGRVGEKRRLHDLLSRFRHAAIIGAPGVGKSRLATHAAYDLLSSFPDGVWILDANRIEEPEDVWRMVGELAPDPRSLEMLVIVDSDTSCGIERILQEMEGGPAVLFACCYPSGVDPSRCVELSGLGTEPGEDDTSEAACLLIDRLKERSPGSDPTSFAESLEAICRKVEGNPLAIEWLVAKVETLGPRSLLDRLSEDSPILWGGSTIADRRSPLRASFDAAFARLTPQEVSWFDQRADHPPARLISSGMVSRTAEGWDVPALVRGYLAARGAERA